MVPWLLAITIVGLSVACVVPPLRLLAKLRRHVRRAPIIATDSQLPPVVLVLPCKGQPDELEELEENLQHMLTQEYPRYRVVFAVSDPRDAARPVFDRLCAKYPHAQLVIASTPLSPSNKLSNQLHALRRVEPNDEVFVFMDADARPHPRVLRDLVAPLADEGIGATTGFRWYTPRAGMSGFGSWLRAAWNAGGMPFLTEPRYNYAWGGAMAIRRSVFETCKVGEYWSRALSDDLGLSWVVKKAGYRIELVPSCLVQSPEDLSLRKVLEWTTRQTLICRVYNPVMWRDLFVGEGITLTAGVLAVLALARGTEVLQIAGAAALLILVLGRFLYQALVIHLVRQLAPNLVTAGSAWRLVLLSVLAHPLILGNSAWSCRSRRLTWRGISYYLASPTETIVLNG